MKILSEILLVVIPEGADHVDKLNAACGSCYMLCSIMAILVFGYLIVTLVKPENF
jgi:hypothetical protein